MKNNKVQKKHLKNKGFTLVEVLAVIVIIAILSTGVVYSVSTYIETGKNSYNESLEKQVALSAKSFYPENSSRIPVRVGEYDYITFQELASLKYLKGDVLDADERNCMAESYVAVEQTNDGLKYTVCLICGEEPDKKSYIKDKKACHKDEAPEVVEQDDPELTCNVYSLGNKKFKFEITNGTNVNQIEEMGYYKNGEKNNKIELEKALQKEYDLSTKPLGQYKFYIVQYGKQEKECTGTAIVEEESNIKCNATSNKNALETEMTTTLELTNESTNGKDPINLVTQILKYKNDKLETTYTKTGTNKIPSDLKFTSTYGAYIYQIVYDEDGITKTTTCTGDTSLEIPDLEITKKFVPTSSYSTYNGGKISDSALNSLTDYSNTNWQNGYVYVKINNPEHFKSVKVNGMDISTDYFWISVQGENKLTAIEALGKDSLETEKIRNIYTKLDRTTPAVTISAKKKTAGTAVSSGSWSNQGLNFTLTKGTTGPSGATIYYCKDASNTCTPTTTIASGTAITAYNTTTGTYYIRYKITGGSGISSSVGSYTAKVDTTTPTVTISAKKKTAGTAVSSGSWSNQGLNFTLTKTAAGASGATIYYCKDTANTCNPTTTISSGTSITSYNTLTGIYYIRYKITGTNGISSSIGSYTAQVDTTTPTVTITAKKKTAGTVVSSGSWSNQGLNFTLTKGTTGPSGATIYYCKDTANTCNPTTTITSGTSITSYNGTAGTYYIRYKITGGSGISSTVGSYTAKVDATTPTVTIAAKKKTEGTAVSSGSWSNQGLNFTLTKGTTGLSGATIYYCKDTANTCTPTTTIASGTQITSYNTLTGTYYIRYKITGGSGISSTVGSYTAKVDATTPTVTIAAKKKTAGTAVSSGSWSNQGLNFTLTKGTTGLSGATIYYCKDTANTCTPSTTIASGTAITAYNTTTGTYYIRYKITGGSGISSTVGSYTAKVDTTTPTVTISAKKKTAGTAVSSGSWSNQGLNFTLTKGTTGSSGATIYYCKDTANTCTPSTTIASGTQITSYNTLTGTYYIRYKITGGSGISSTVGSYTAKVDATTPTVTIAAKKKTAGTAVSSGSWSNQGLNFTLTKGTTGSSGATIYYCKDTANTCTPSTTIASGTAITAYNTATGTYYIRYKITGGSGISSSVGSYTAKVDTTAPTLTYSNSSNSKWVNETVTIKATASDSQSGVDTSTIGYYYVDYDFANSKWGSWTTSSTTGYWGSDFTSNTTSSGITTKAIRGRTFSDERRRKMKIEACDNVGNCTKTVETYVYIDKTAPSISLSNSSGGSWTNKDITVTVTISEAFKYSTIDESTIKYHWKTSGEDAYSSYLAQSYWTSLTSTNSSVSGYEDKVVKTVAKKNYSGNNFSRVFQARACDLAGNCDTSSTTNIKQDTTGPVCKSTEFYEIDENNKRRYKYTFTDNLSGVKAERHGHCYAETSYNKNDTAVLCKTSSAYERLKAKRDADSWDYTFSTAYTSCWKSYGYVYSEGTLYIYFDVKDVAGNVTNCKKFETPYYGTYKHTW